MNRTIRSRLVPDFRWIAFDIGVGVTACSKLPASVHLLLASSAAVLAIAFLLVHWAMLNDRGFARHEAPASFPLSASSHCFCWAIGLLIATAYWRVG